MTDNKQHIKNLKKLKSFHNGSYGADIDRAIKALEQEPKWIPVSERLPMLDEEACSDDVLIQLKDTKFSISEGACSIHITKIARYDENAISSDGRYMDTEGWILDNGYTLSMDEVIAWMPLPKSLKAESEE